jgi:2-dehydropantoate 2-reductase
MKIVIYGAGGIGSIVGGFLKLAGYDVVLIGRPAHVKAVNEKGLQLVGPSGTRLIQMKAVADPDEINFKPGDVVFLCMKGQDTEQALHDLRSVIGQIPVFCFQNGVRNEEIAANSFRGVYGVMVQVGAVYLNAGEVTVRREPPGRLIIGQYPNGSDELAESTSEQLRKAGFWVKVSADVMAYKWGKLVGNLGNAIGAITNEKQKDTAFIYHAVMQEMSDILSRAGIHWVSAEELDREWPDSIQPRGELTNEAQSSTWQSLARGQGSVETEFLNGEAVRLAKKLGIHAPINAALLRISQEMAAKCEKPGKYSGTQLAELLGLKP